MSGFSDADLIGFIPALRRYANKLIQKDIDQAEDLVQSVLERAVKKRDKFAYGGKEELRRWVFTIMHNQWVNLVRVYVRQGMADTYDNKEDVINAVPDIDDPASGLIIRDLARAIKTLPQEQQEAVRLVAYQGMKYEDAADLVDVPVGTIRSRLSRGRSVLRQYLS